MAQNETGCNVSSKRRCNLCRELENIHAEEGIREMCPYYSLQPEGGGAAVGTA